MITVKTFGNYKRQDLAPELMTGCDHDQNVYHYRLVDGAMVLRGIVLGHGWEHRQMDWQGLSCYKRKEDEQMALITKESGKPEARKDKDEIMAKAKVLIAGGLKITEAARELNVPAGTLHTWMGKEKKRAEKAKELLESVDAGKPVTNYGGPVDLINLTIDDCHKITKRLFGDRLTENQDGTVNIGQPVRSMGCIAPIGVEVPQYEPEDNDYLDNELVAYQAANEHFDPIAGLKVDLIRTALERGMYIDLTDLQLLRVIQGIQGLTA